MDLQTRKLEFIKEFLKIQSEDIIERLEKLLKKEKTTDFWNGLSPEQKKEIEKASLEIKNGKVTDYDSFIQKHK
ncbi:hypothetical protein [Flavivirga algicola]|uniref:Uncharacterized protein n=1 Tax=Flavivirga algicola TaxID=2729136 RepID=A0ABX1RT18_9FLAO|nr:hypothetical protein [Flavivirga algicola]NMH86702.1 hypothetical protein [Flavivirga algicola]